MARLVTTTCPKCGANVAVEPGADRAVCSYCKTVSHLKATQAMPAVTSGTSASTALLVGGAVLIAVILGCVAGAFVLVSTRASTAAEAITSAPPPTAAPIPVPVPVEPPVVPDPPVPPPAPELHVLQGARLFASDLDGDTHVEIVLPIESAGAHYAAFDAHSGDERARTPILEDLRTSLVALAGTDVKRLLVATRLGQLSAYDMGSGALQWTTALADRVVSLCNSSTAGSVHVTTADQRRLLVDLTTGRQSDTRETCAPAIAIGEGMADPRDRHDYAAPAGVEAYECGTVRVMGSANFSVSDQCRARGHVDSEHLDGMVGHRIWKHGNGWLVFGVRVPGRYVPRLGLYERNRFTWAADVPATNPLDAEEGGPGHVALAGDAVLATYETESDDTSWITAFAVADGARRFTVSLGPDEQVSDLAVTEDAAVVRLGDLVRVLELADGSTRVTLGE